MANIKVNGVNIYYEIRGRQTADHTVMFLNGVMASTGSWLPLSDFFEKKGYRVILHDFRGQLQSEKPAGEWTFSDHADDMAGLMRELDIDSAHLVGTSYGGEAALQFALMYPDKTKSITVIDSVSELSPLLEASVKAWIDAAKLKDGRIFYRLLLPWLYSSSFMMNNAEMLKDREEAVSRIPEDYFDGQISLYRTFLTIDLTDELEKIKCPALIICGEEDILKPPAFSKIISEKIRGSEYVQLPGCGHVAIFEKTEELKSLIGGFLRKTEA